MLGVQALPNGLDEVVLLIAQTEPAPLPDRFVRRGCLVGPALDQQRAGERVRFGRPVGEAQAAHLDDGGSPLIDDVEVVGRKVDHRSGAGGQRVANDEALDGDRGEGGRRVDVGEHRRCMQRAVDERGADRPLRIAVGSRSLQGDDRFLVGGDHRSHTAQRVGHRRPMCRSFDQLGAIEPSSGERQARGGGRSGLARRPSLRRSLGRPDGCGRRRAPRAASPVRRRWPLRSTGGPVRRSDRSTGVRAPRSAASQRRTPCLDRMAATASSSTSPGVSPSGRCVPSAAAVRAVTIVALHAWVPAASNRSTPSSSTGCQRRRRSSRWLCWTSAVAPSGAAYQQLR
jgi:hypothetical protein